MLKKTLTFAIAWVQYNDLTVMSDGWFWGAKGVICMYHWIEDKAFLGRMKGLCGDLVNQLVQAINRDGLLEVRQHLVGSGAKNLITQNANRPIDLDYNLEILRCEGINVNDGRRVKEYVREIFDDVLRRTGWEPCDDSTSALTTKLFRFEDGDQTPFSIDLCITREDDFGRRLRLIHNKTGMVQSDSWIWNEAPYAKGLEDRVDWLKDNDCWTELREVYLEKKNLYLSGNDHDHPSYIVYIEAVNQVYSKYNPGDEYRLHTGVKLSETMPGFSVSAPQPKRLSLWENHWNN